MREQEWLDKLDCVNKKRAYTTIEEAKRIQKEYVKNNFEKIQKYKKEWEINNPEKIKEYRKNNAEKNKAYRSVKIECECGTIITRSHIADHRKRPIHLNNLLKTTNCFS
jgi:hypothetical protein